MMRGQMCNNWTGEEDQLIALAAQRGEGLSVLRAALPGRTDNAIAQRLKEARRRLGMKIRAHKVDAGTTRKAASLHPDDPGIVDTARPAFAKGAKNGSAMLLAAIRRHHPERFAS